MDPKLKAQLRKRFAKGTLFEGKFRIEGHLGTGSFAYVMLARHEAMDRRVALKVLKPELVSANPELLKRFVNEVKIVAKLSHPNTVTVFDYGRTEDGIHYLVMEYVEGVSLDAVIEEQGALSPHRAVAVTRQILKSLAEAHTLGIVHRDLKPSNIMLSFTHDEQEIVKVLDFGVAKLVERRSPEKPNQFERRSTQFVGTPVYMSPEQVLGQDVVPASDLYALGLILHEMLTGNAPFEKTSVAHIAQAHIDPDPLPLEGLDTLTNRFQQLILRATSREVADRFQDVGSFARALPDLGESDFSVEFSKLMDDDYAFKEAVGLEGVSENTWDAFSGRNYIEAPKSESIEELPLPLPPKKKPKPAQPVRLNWQEESGEEQQRPSSSVELNLGQVKRDDLRRKRDQRDRTGGQPVVMVQRYDWRSGAWIVGGLIAAFASFLVASTVWVDGDGPDRWVVGLLPWLAAFVWSKFASVQRHLGGTLDRVVVPFARHMVWTTLSIVVIVCIISPEAGASRMENAGTWFVDDIPDDSPLRALHAVSSLFASALSMLFSVASKVFPW